MKKNIWILNHYATNTFFELGGRHFWFGKYLLKMGYNPVIICASTIHNKDTNIQVEGQFLLKKVLTEYGDLNYLFMKTPSYSGNGLSRIINMILFSSNLIINCRKIAEITHVPDVIIASSVHPFTLFSGIKIAKKFKIKCISEIRDLWPETIFEYKRMNKESLFARIRYS